MSDTETSLPATNGAARREPALQQPPVFDGKGSSGINAAFLLQAVLRWWPIALPAGLVLAVVGTAAGWLLFTPTFRAEAWLRIEDRRPYVAFPTQEESKRFVQTQVELLRSPVIIAECLSRPDVAQLPELQQVEDPLEWLLTRLTVAGVGESELFRIRFEGPNPVNAVTITNMVVEAYLKQHSSEGAAEVQRIIELLNKEKERRLKEIERLQENLRTMTKQVTGRDLIEGMTGGKDGQMLASPIAALQDRLTSAEVEREVLEAQFKAAESALASQDTAAVPVNTLELDQAVAADSEVQAINAELLASQLRLREYEAQFAEAAKKETGQRMRKRVEDLQAALTKRKAEVRQTYGKILAQKVLQVRRDELASVQKQLEAQRHMESLLRKRVEEERAQLEKLGDQALNLEFARNELARSEEVFRRITDRITALRTEQSAPARASLLRKATKPELPINNPYMTMAGLGGAAFGLPFLLAVLWEYRVRRVSGAQQLQEEIRLPVIGEVTTLPIKSMIPAWGASDRFERHRHMFQESIAQVRTSLLLSDGLQGLQVLAVGSAVSGEGKTHLAAQLAVNIGKSTGKPTLLIDADVRDPDMHRMFDIPLTPGLVSVLNKSAELDEAILPLWEQRIHLLPAGNLQGSPHGLFAGSSFTSMLARLRKKYRYIVIDCPPLLSASESLVLAKAADGTLLCTMRDVSRVTQVRHARDRLTTAGAHTLGIVLSGASPTSYLYRYGGYYTRSAAAEESVPA
jgi:capsular exopolysaccharide synthesis family protein